MTICRAAAGGDILILLAAFMYSMVTVRLSKLSPSFDSITLAASKSTALAGTAILALLWACAQQWLREGFVASQWPGIANPAAWGFILWSGLGPAALVAYLQAKVGPVAALVDACRQYAFGLGGWVAG